MKPPGGDHRRPPTHGDRAIRDGALGLAGLLVILGVFGGVAGEKHFLTKRLATWGPTWAQNLGKLDPDPPKSRPGPPKIAPGALQDVIFKRRSN